MTVLCIRDTPNSNEELNPLVPVKIKKGQKYDVARELNKNGIDYYELSFDLGVLYLMKCFIPLSDISIEELIGERELQ